MAAPGLHEDYRREGPVERGSERSFGLTFAVVLALIGGWQLWSGRLAGSYWLGGAAVFLALALAWHAPLRPLNRLWFRLSMLLYGVVSPLVMALLFYGTVTPVGLLMRMVGQRPLHLRREPGRTSYWIERNPPGPAPETMTRQF